MDYNQKFMKNSDYFYYETENYKNYKYKLYNINIDEIAKKKFMGKKILISDYNFPSDHTKISEKKNIVIDPEFTKEKIFKDRENNKLLHKQNRSTLVANINKLSLDLTIANSLKKNQKSTHQTSENDQSKVLKNIKELPPLVNPFKNDFHKQDEKELLNKRVMSILNHKKEESLSPRTFDSQYIKNNSLPKIEDKKNLFKKIGGGFSISVNPNTKHPMRKNIDKNILEKIDSKPNNKTSKINEKINFIISSRKIKKNKKFYVGINQKIKKTNYEEFIYLSEQSEFNQNGFYLFYT